MITENEYAVLRILGQDNPLSVPDIGMYLMSWPRAVIEHTLDMLLDKKAVEKREGDGFVLAFKGALLRNEYESRPEPEPEPEPEPDDYPSAPAQEALDTIMDIPRVVHDALAVLESENYFDQTLGGGESGERPFTPGELPELRDKIMVLAVAASQAKSRAVLFLTRWEAVKASGGRLVKTTKLVHEDAAEAVAQAATDAVAKAILAERKRWQATVVELRDEIERLHDKLEEPTRVDEMGLQTARLAADRALGDEAFSGYATLQSRDIGAVVESTMFDIDRWEVLIRQFTPHPSGGWVICTDYGITMDVGDFLDIAEKLKKVL